MVNILIVEDNIVIRKVIEKTIHICGIVGGSIFEASNGKEGLSIMDKKQIDLMLIDINMPVMDGMQMLKKVREKQQAKDLPILIVSAESNEERIEEINRLGAEFIHKPFTPEMLRGRLLEIINKE
jgi:two-component system chemotaxis response regulator CheY